MSELGKPFVKKNKIKKLKKKTKNQCQNAVCEKTTSGKLKLVSNEKIGLEQSMNGLGKQFKKTIQNLKENRKLKLPDVNKNH